MSDNTISFLNGLLAPPPRIARTGLHGRATRSPAGQPERLLLEASSLRQALAAMAALSTASEVEAPSRLGAARDVLIRHAMRTHQLVNVPATMVGDTLVPAFRVGQFLCGRGLYDTIQIDSQSVPWTSIPYAEALRVSYECGLALLTERQALAIAQDILRQPVNWTGGAVGVGRLYQGLHQGVVSRPQAATYLPRQQIERRWHVLSNGDIIFDMAGNAYSWIFDDVQGDARGVVARGFAPNSPTTARSEEWPHDIGAGDGPLPGTDYRGEALIRGGHAGSGAVAGIFHFRTHVIERGEYEIGFRVTAPVRAEVASA